MNSDLGFLVLLMILCFAFGMLVGGLHAEAYIAVNCKRLNSFNVADITYDCNIREEEK